MTVFRAPVCLPACLPAYLEKVASQPRLVRLCEVRQYVALGADEEALFHEAGVHDQAAPPAPVDQHLGPHVSVPPARHALRKR